MSTTTLLGQYPDLADRTYQVVRDQILTNQLPPGSRLVIVELAQRLGVSRTPVKDALSRLAVEGLVEDEPRKGYFVTRLDPQDIVDLIDARLIIERAAIERGIHQVRPTDILDMQRIVDAMSAQLDADGHYRDYGQYIAADVALHETMVLTARNTRLQSMYRGLHPHLYLTRIHYLFDDRASPRSFANLQEHRAMVQAFESHDLASLTTLITTHIQYPLRHLTLLSRAPN
ncbi:MAG TPA: GntR family transcriptional regulator [Chloroflexota bacterium]|nr:GntR family transcriptional regulator [Chloroflexota bacterium]